MFVKYKIKGGISDTDNSSHNAIMADWVNIMNGTHTTVNDFDTAVADVSSCEFVGSPNTSIYHTVSYDQCSSTSDEGYLQLFKRHNYYLTDSNYNMQRQIRCGISPSSADMTGVIVGTASSTNFRPTTATNFATGFSPEVNLYLSNSPTFYFYVSDYWFMWQMYDDQRNDTAWGGVLDYDVTDHDKYVYDDIDSDYSAQVTWCGSMTSQYNTQQSSSSVLDSEWAGRQNYLSIGGTITSQGTWNTSSQEYLWGYTDNYNSDYNMMFPQNQRVQYPIPLTTGDSAHQMVPMYLLPHSNNTSASDPVIANFKYIWRTTDDIGNPGQTITFNGVDYVVLMGNKTGSNAGGSTVRTGQACYLLQKTIGGK